MSIYRINVVHIKKVSPLSGNTIYLGRGQANKKFNLLANSYSHLEKSLAKYKVGTVEEAIICFDRDLVKNLKDDKPGYRYQMRELVELTKALIVAYGEVNYACWCKHELKPGKNDHGCHCDSLRKYVLVKLEKEI